MKPTEYEIYDALLASIKKNMPDSVKIFWLIVNSKNNLNTQSKHPNPAKAGGFFNLI